MTTPKRNISRLAAAAALALFLGGCLGDDDKDYTLTLLHTNDMHGHWETFGSEGSLGGLARLKTAVDDVRAERGSDNILLVDAGDYFQGTLFFNAWRGSDAVMALNSIGYDAATLGNHEFDLGPDGLAAAMRGDAVEIAGVGYVTEAVEVPIVATNLDYSAEPELAGADWLQDSVVLERGGRRFAVLGILTDTTSNIASPGPNIQFLDYVASVQAEVDRLEADGVNHIILLSHINHADDLALAAALRGVDIIVSGHDHRLLGNAAAIAADPLTADFADLVYGPYPARATAADRSNVLIVSAWEWARVLGRLDVTFDEQGRVKGWSGGPIFINESIAEDAEVAARVAEYRAPVDDLAGVDIGTAGVLFDGSRIPGVRTQEMPLGNLVADVLLDYAAPALGADVALTNGGGIRATIEAGTVTFGDALSVLPFGNTITVVEVTGAELVAALDNGLSWAYDADANATRSSGAFPQVAGMTVTFCGETVSDIQAGTLPPAACATAMLEGGLVTSVSIDGTAIDLQASYRVASNNFLVNGGDFYGMFAEACARDGGFCQDSFVLMLDELVREFENGSPVTRVVEGRLAAE
jgi:5'-nucleotidase